MSSRSFSVGGYTRSIEQEEDPFTSRVMGFKNDSLPDAPEKFEDWQAPLVKEAIEGIQRADGVQQTSIANREMADVFLAAHPEYVDSKANGELMNHELKRSFGEGAYTLAQYEQAYDSLRASNFLALNKTEVEKQRKAAAQARVQAERAKSVEPSMDELYQMPLEDLRRLDAQEAQKRFQRRGEEGGW